MQKLILLIVAFLFTSNAREVCNVLALSGGGNKGAYEAGVVKGLVDSLPGDQVRWDIVTGISVGSVLASTISCFAIGDEVNMAEQLVKIASTLREEDIFQEWPLGLVEGLTLKSGLFDSSPLRVYLNNTFNRYGGFKDRKFVIGATSYRDGKLRLWNETFAFDDVVTGVMASSAIPGVFDVVNFDEDDFGDGGILQNINIDDGVSRCLEEGFELKDIVVDAILCDSDTLKTVDADKYDALGIWLRSREVGRFKSTLDIIAAAKEAYPEAQFRYIVYPSQVLPGSSLIDFSPGLLDQMVQIGIADAKKAVGQKNGFPL